MVLAVASRPLGRMAPFSAVLPLPDCADFFWPFTTFGGGLGVEEEEVVVGGVTLGERGVVLGVLVRVLVPVDVVHAGESVDDTGREEGDNEEGDTVEAVDVAVSVCG
ncbi:hypothetical protein NDU88_005376 [Pleurodeles waltl]|uniref:Uncharacterized protein n=1 Tax=Pleurodeles waltl TaxID=8319 RepID=A0AAV7MW81_PLEWA|nr:hypothetical protein NDU88_005376 [Pleurodeles waltl]